jgi:hypothetical protein
MSQYRCGFDTLVEFRGRLVILEIKNPEGRAKLTEKETKVQSMFRNSFIVETWEEAFRAIGAIVKIGKELGQ